MTNKISQVTMANRNTYTLNEPYMGLQDFLGHRANNEFILLDTTTGPIVVNVTQISELFFEENSPILQILNTATN